jgi:two-component system OmpR family response regulator
MKTVLVVDDSDSVLERVKKALEGGGYQVITRNKPSGSVAAILRDKPDVVLLDVNMPSLSGDTIAKILSRVSQNLETLVLLHSSLSIDNLRLKAIATGAHGYIQKTDSPTEIVRRVEYWLNRSRYASSASRLEAAPASGTSPPPGAPTSSGRFTAAPYVGGATTASSGPASESKLDAAPTSAPGSSRTASASSASSSSKLRAAAAASSSPSYTSRSSSSMATARTATSTGSLKAAPRMTDGAPTAGGTPTSRNMRAAKATASGERPKVLFVDDDWKMLSSYRTMVAGFVDAEFVSSSDDAFSRLLSEKPPQVVVCDVVMPGLSGADIYRRAVLLDRAWATRFVFVTGAASTPSVAEFLNTLDVRVFHKPVATDRLLDTLKQMMEGQRR